MSDLVTCATLYGGPKDVQKNELIFRPSVYGIVMHEGRLLVTQMRGNGKYMIPGGGVNPGEVLEEALKRECWEECGIVVEVGKPLFWNESFFYCDPVQQAWHALSFIYEVCPLSSEVHDKNNEPQDESVKPIWVDIAGLQPSDFQVMGDKILATLTKSS